LRLGAKPEPAWNETSTADQAFVTVTPPADQYVFLMLVFGNVGTDGDVIELQAYCQCHSAWQKFLRLKCLANTTIIQGFPNMKLDKITLAGEEHTIAKGDGENPRFQIVSRGTGPWEAGVIYFVSS